METWKKHPWQLVTIAVLLIIIAYLGWMRISGVSVSARNECPATCTSEDCPHLKNA